MNREDLREYKYNREFIKEKFEYIDELKETICKVTSTISDMPKGTRQVDDSMAEKIADLLDSVDEILELVKEMDKKQKEIEKRIISIAQPYRLILEKVYIQGKTLVTVASEMNYSYREMKRKHNKALEKFEKL